MKALVVFCDNGNEGHPLLPLLRPGFKHCFCAVLDNGLWILADNRRGVPLIRYLTTEEFDLAGFYRDEGATVVETTQRETPLRGPYVAANCVGLVKSILCIRSFAVTPYGLYLHLKGRS